MKSLKGEVMLNIPAQKAWEMYRNNETMTKINPEMLADAFYLKGDGAPGSIRVFKFGPALSSYVKESKERIERVEIGRSVTYQVIGGDLAEMYNPYTVTFSFNPVPGNEMEKCSAEWGVEFEAITSNTPPPERAREAALGFLQCFDKYQLTN